MPLGDARGFGRCDARIRPVDTVIAGRPSATTFVLEKLPGPGTRLVDGCGSLGAHAADLWEPFIAPTVFGNC